MHEFFPEVGMCVSAIDGYVGIVIATHKTSQCMFTVFVETTQKFIDLNLLYVDRITQEHILLNVNKKSLDLINIQ